MTVPLPQIAVATAHRAPPAGRNMGRARSIAKASQDEISVMWRPSQDKRTHFCSMQGMSRQSRPLPANGRYFAQAASKPK
jgi:hypothetical protein